MEERTTNAVKLVGEVFVPGASQMIEGHVARGAAHFVIGGLVVAALAPAAPLLAGLFGLGVRLNSFSSSMDGKNLWNQVEVRKTNPEPHSK
ncbi:hypothetical protein LQG66_33765 [Bradyrhizobium ontarionense]|uniref:Uncharacterized protein n=1 Tax=Bradyrhizobium ontarionense TaxID=2898149 RepID=A0ABY3RBC2_9BRAD|nr:DUF6072 family protein [Bradyrhizobium sp. A19]UFZ04106.1 hypothetical protein LQG66_33765 [Bradyrhizobium sp. A19]